MYVSMYEKAFRDAFSETLAELDGEPFEGPVKKIVDRIAEDIVDKVRDDINDRFISSIGDTVCAKAAEVARWMLEEALAGDDEQLRNLFGFYQHPPGSLAWRAFWHPRPERWVLIEEFIRRNPEFFISERIDQLSEEMAALRTEKTRLLKRLDWWQAKAEGREPEGAP